MIEIKKPITSTQNFFQYLMRFDIAKALNVHGIVLKHFGD
jgi:hypothetical protein